MRKSLLFFLVVFLCLSKSFAQFPYYESFTNSTAPGIVYGGSFLTAGAPTNEGEGKGFLRLTNNQNDQKGYIYSTTNFPSTEGLSIEFEYFTYGGTGADGITFFLFDATAAPFSIGGFGGSLGYAPYNDSKVTSPGLSKGYLGIGLDEYGNFSNPIEGRTGGLNGLRPGSVTLRGSYTEQYKYLTSAETDPTPIGQNPGEFTLESKTGTRVTDPSLTGYRKAFIDLKPRKGPGQSGFDITVRIMEGGSTPVTHTLISSYPYDLAPPSLLRYGIASSTGYYTNFHEIRNLRINYYDATPQIPPKANNDSRELYSEDPGYFIDVTENDVADGTKVIDKSQTNILTQPANGTVIINPLTFELVYIPKKGYTGPDSFTYNVKDNLGFTSNTAIVSLTVKPRPKGTTDTLYTIVNRPVNNFSITNNDQDKAGTTVVKKTNPAKGTLVVNNDGTINYAPETDVYGTFPFTYALKNADGAESDPITVVIIVNKPPVAVDDTYHTSINTDLVKKITENDTDVDGAIDHSKIVIKSTPTNGGGLTTNPQGVITYKPSPGYTGTDSFTYTIKDNKGEESNVATVTITIHPLPKIGLAKSLISAVEAPNNSYDVKFKFTLTNPGQVPLENISLKDDLTTTFPGMTFGTKSIVVGPASTLMVNTGFNGNTTKDLLSGGSKLAVGATETLELTINVKMSTADGVFQNKATVEGVFPLTGEKATDNSTDGLKPDPVTSGNVSPENPTPINLPLPKRPVAKNDIDTAYIDQSQALKVLDNDEAKDGKVIQRNSISIVSDPTNGKLSIYQLTGEVTYIPNSGYSGPDSFTYTVNDNFNLTSNIATVYIVVLPLPKGRDDLIKTNKNVPVLSYPVKDNDPDKTGTTVLKITDPAKGQVAINPDGTINYTPATDDYGTYTFTYKLRNADGAESDPITVTIEVNDPPVANPDNVPTPINTPVTIDVAGNDTDADGNIVRSTVVIKTPPSNGTPVVSADGTVIYTPDNGFEGTDSFTYTIKDDDGTESQPATVTILVRPNPRIGVAKAAASVTRALNGSYDIRFLFTLKNFGEQGLQNISLKDDLGLAFPGTQFIVKSVIASGTLSVNTAYNGFSNTELLNPASTLSAGSIETVELVLNVKLTERQGVFLNTATVQGSSLTGNTTSTDQSTSGFKPDPVTNGDVSPSDPTIVELTYPPLFIPGGFSPNNDGVNDLFVIRNTGSKKIDIEIFNRWGNRVYRSGNYENNWDGKCKEGLCLGQDLPPGTYYYIILLDKTEKYTGYITLNR